MKKAVILILALILLAGAGFFLWQNRYEFFFQGDKGDEVAEDEFDESLDGILDDEDVLDDEFDEDEDDEEGEFDSDENEYESPAVSSKHCDNNCRDFSGSELDYCREICGFAEVDENRRADNCDELAKFERDACFKQKAIDEKNASFCAKISDADLRENCENRVLEEVIR